MPFRRCPYCDHRWSDREAFLGDPVIALSGCQVDTDHPLSSALLFDHKVACCGATVAVGMGAFPDL